MTITREHIIQSNLIEGVKDLNELPKSMKAWEYLTLTDKIITQTILDTHYLIMQELLPVEHIGTFRIRDVFVGDYKAPGAYLVPHLMQNWISDMNYYQDLDPKIKHVDFERIHPFIDGNGRVGRMLFWWHEMKLGLKPTLITYNKRNDYYNWFKTEYK
jgi:Fic family protein